MSTGVMALATITDPLIGTEYGIATWLDDLRASSLVDSVFGAGWLAELPFVLLLVFALGLAFRALPLTWDRVDAVLLSAASRLMAAAWHRPRRPASGRCRARHHGGRAGSRRPRPRHRRRARSRRLARCCRPSSPRARVLAGVSAARSATALVASRRDYLAGRRSRSPGGCPAVRPLTAPSPGPFSRTTRRWSPRRSLPRTEGPSQRSNGRHYDRRP